MSDTACRNYCLQIDEALDKFIASELARANAVHPFRMFAIHRDQVPTRGATWSLFVCRVTDIANRRGIQWCALPDQVAPQDRLGQETRLPHTRLAPRFPIS